ncbi:hypothetical protein EZV62_022916 [Acer yangbiense]|uniref:KIB1-4 beta-propeller domain-containing protein n=1 Tax=Acer yangbiense TaxID=1000413 RepID=A0A5C7H1M4_9ROSI|nr:hypothetical protein EZV62_022916 [Acer yangbiense]
MEILFINKCVLSTSPSLESDYTLVVIYGNTANLAYFRPGFKTWITIDSCRHHYFDVIYYQEQFYAIDFRGRITAIDIKSDDTVVAKKVANLPKKLDGANKLYLVESAGKLLVVARHVVFVEDEFNSLRLVAYGTDAFHVLEVDLSSNKWSQVKNLGNRSLFLGENSSFSVEV